MLIEIWSDVVCPWCYIGKRRLESALAGFEHRDEVEVVFRSFELDPTAPTVGTETTEAALARKVGTDLAEVRRMMGQADAVAREEGLDFRHHQAPHVRTLDAHRLLHLALAEGGPSRQRGLKEALLDAYFGAGRSLGDHEVLRPVAVGAGLDGVRVDAVLASEEYVDAVEADVAQARAFGAQGVPFFVLDRAVGVSGAQPVETLGAALQQAWSSPAPTLSVLPDGSVCGPDGCAI